MGLYEILRLIHILSGVFWAGANFVLAGFINPSVRATAPESGKFMQYLAQRSGFPRYAEIAGWLTILAGIGLYWMASGGFAPIWVTSRRGIILMIGALMALIAFIIGYAVSKPAGKRLGEVSQEIQASGGPPTPEQLAELQKQQNRLTQGARWAAILLVVAVAGMALSR